MIVKEESKIEKVNVMIHQRNEILDELKDNLNKAWNQMKMIKGGPICGTRLCFLINPTLLFQVIAHMTQWKNCPCFHKPYEVLEKIGIVA